MNRAVTYARVSGDDRKKEGRNLKGQLEMYRGYCADKGYRIVAELAEDIRGVSGAELRPPQLEKALNMAAAGEYDVFVTREIDRLARNAIKQATVKEMLANYGVRIEYVLYEFPDTPEGRLNEGIHRELAEYGRYKAAERMIRGRCNIVRGGRVMLHGNFAPYGYGFEEERDDQGHIKSKYLVVNDEEAKVVRRIFSLCVEGETISGIAAALTKDQIPTWSDKHGSPFERKAGFGEWAKSSVYKILSNETYAGTWHYGKQGRKRRNPKSNWVELSCPAIVDSETFNIVQKRLAENKRKSKRRTKRDYLLKGRVICGDCNTSMIGRAEKGGRYMYYYCPAGTGRHIDTDCSNNGYFKVKLVDGRAWDSVKEIIFDPETYRKRLEARKEFLTKQNSPTAQRIEALDRLLKKKHGRHKRLVNLYLDGHMKEGDYLELKADLDKDIRKFEAERASLEGEFDYNPEIIEHLDHLIEHSDEVSRVMRKMGPDLAHNFELKRQWVEVLNVRAILSLEGKERFALIEITPIFSPSVSTNNRVSGKTMGITLRDLLILTSERKPDVPTHLLPLQAGRLCESIHTRPI